MPRVQRALSHSLQSTAVASGQVTCIYLLSSSAVPDPEDRAPSLPCCISSLCPLGGPVIAEAAAVKGWKAFTSTSSQKAPRAGGPAHFTHSGHQGRGGWN